MEIRNFIDPVLANKRLSFSEENISEAFRNQSGHFSYYASKHAQAEKQEARAKLMVELVEARLDKEIRLQAKENKEKVSEMRITRLIALMPEYQQAVKDHINSRQITSVCKAVAESFRQRRDMLIQVGADQREDKKGSLRMKENTSERAHALFGRKSNEIDARN